MGYTDAVKDEPASKEFSHLCSSACRIGLLVLAIYLILLALAFLYDSRTSRRISGGGIDIENAKETIYANTATYFLFVTATSLRSHSGPQTVILGNSVPGRGFPGAYTAGGIPGRAIHNLCVFASNFTMMRQAFERVCLHSRPVDIKNLDVVIGGHLMSFAPNSVRTSGPLRRTPIENEAYRYGLIRIENGSAHSPYPPSLEAWILRSQLPLLLLKRIKRHLIASAYWLEPRIVGSRNVVRTGEWWDKRLERDYGFSDGRVPAEQFGALAALVADIRAAGAQPVYVDMPMTTHFRNDHSYYSDYRRRILAFVGQTGVPHIDLHDLSPDSDFVDGAHPADRGKRIWSRNLTDRLRVLRRSHSPRKETAWVDTSPEVSNEVNAW